MATPVRVGAVLYDPRVSTIWEIIQDFFEERGCPIAPIFFADYGLQVDALLAGWIDVAWNSPLAWLDAQRRSREGCRAIAMRDTDRDRVSHLVVPADSAFTRPEDLRGGTIAVGAKDSPQATLIPLGFLHESGLEVGTDFRVERFDVLVGKHGDHIGGEREAFLHLGRGLADACAMLDLNWAQWSRDGTVDPARYRILASTARFDHCVFTVEAGFPPEVEQQWLDVLFSMSYEDPAHREMMDLEGLKAWLPGRTTGFGLLAAAVARTRFWS